MSKIVFVVLTVMVSSALAMTVNFTTPVVETSSGSLHGVRTTVNGRLLTKFLGVPYAQAPIGALRFRAPLPYVGGASSGTTTSVDTTAFRPSCMQPPHLRRVIYRPLHEDLDESSVSEDCLYLNMYVPERATTTDETEKMAVMIWIPGEGFDFGYANQYDGSRLATHGNVIVVTVNYRLSAFGFLATGDADEAPGNVGIRDQLQAIQWLRDNVARFGGDPERLTVFGRLTGSMSASVLVASPRSRDQLTGKSIFRRAILQSGVAQGEWVFEKNPLEQAKMLAATLNCSSSSSSSDTSDVSEMLGCLRQVPASTLLRTAISSPRPWRLTLDNDFLPRGPLSNDVQVAADVDVLIGANEHEGSLCLLTHLAQKTEYMDKMVDNNFTSIDLHDLMKSHVEDFYRTRSVDNELHDTAQLQYPCDSSASSTSSDGQVAINCRQQFLTFCGDLYIHSAVSKLANKLADLGRTVYRYEFTHRPNFSHFPHFVGAAQGDEVLFVFGLVEDPSLDNATKEEIKLSHQMMTAWSNFAKTGNPNPIQRDLSWPRYSGSNGRILDISLNMSPQSVRSDLHGHRLTLWTQLSENSS